MYWHENGWMFFLVFSSFSPHFHSHNVKREYKTLSKPGLYNIHTKVYTNIKVVQNSW